METRYSGTSSLTYSTLVTKLKMNTILHSFYFSGISLNIYRIEEFPKEDVERN